MASSSHTHALANVSFAIIDNDGNRTPIHTIRTADVSIASAHNHMINEELGDKVKANMKNIEDYMRNILSRSAVTAPKNNKEAKEYLSDVY